MDFKIFWKGFLFGAILSIFFGVYTFYAMTTAPKISLDEIEMVDLNGKKINSSNLLQGKPLVLNFWATWCAPCVSEFSEFEVANKKFGKKVSFVMVSDEPVGKILGFKNQKNYNLNIFKSNKALSFYGINTIPVTYFFDKNGKLEESIIGSITNEELEKKINSLLKKFSFFSFNWSKFF